MAKAFARKGNVLYKMKKYDEAIEQYENSLLEKHNDKVYAMVKKSKVINQAKRHVCHVCWCGRRRPVSGFVVVTQQQPVQKLRKKAAEEAYWDKDKAAEAKARGNAAFKEGKRERTRCVQQQNRIAVLYFWCCLLWSSLSVWLFLFLLLVIRQVEAGHGGVLRGHQARPH